MSLPKSSDETVLLHNPRCSKSRATLALLEEHEASFEVREYLNDPLGRDELVDLPYRRDFLTYDNHILDGDIFLQVL